MAIPLLVPLIMAGVSIASTIAGGISSANAARAQGADDLRTARLRALLANRQAMDAVSRGNYEAGLHRMKGTLTIGAQRAAAGASGVDSSSGTAAEVFADTRVMSELDALTTQNNALREAWGYKVQSSQALEAGLLAKKRADAQATAHLVQAGMSAVGTAADIGGKLVGGGGGGAAGYTGKP